MSSVENEVKPVRLQRSRKKGSRLVSPNGLPVVCVTRGTKWGNPYRAGDIVRADLNDPNSLAIVGCDGSAVDLFQEYAAERLAEETGWLDPLRGMNLACWCKSGKPCHADVLLKLANE